MCDGNGERSDIGVEYSRYRQQEQNDWMRVVRLETDSKFQANCIRP